MEAAVVATYIRPMSREGKHHYIPVFYLKQWNGDNHKICEFSRPRALVTTKRVGPKSTGFVHGLYSIPGLPAEEAQYIEKKYMQKLDDKAARALQRMLTQPPGQIVLSEELTIYWAAFLYSLILRSPEIIAVMGVELETKRTEFRSMSIGTASITDADGVRHTVTVKHRPLHAQEFLPGFIAGQVVRELVAMRWQTISTASANHPMLTSDRPVIMTNGFAHPEGHVAIPISPTLLFLATRPEGTYEAINSMNSDELVISVNNNVCIHAIDYVYGLDDREWLFVAERLGRRVQSTPIG